MCTHAGVVSQDECPYCNPTPRPWKDRREDLALLIEDPAYDIQPVVHQMLCDCRDEIDRLEALLEMRAMFSKDAFDQRERLIGSLAEAFQKSHEVHFDYKDWKNCSWCALLREADEVSRG